VGESFQSGIDGLALEPGDHICALFFGQRERDELVAPFLRAGVRAGDKCFCIVDACPEDDEVAHAVATAQVEVRPPRDHYLRGKPFVADEMISFFDDSVGQALAEGPWTFARTTGEATWLTDKPPEAEEFFLYESRLNTFAPRYPQVILCLYDLEVFGGSVLVDLMHTHRKILMGGMLIENPHYLSPEDYLSTRSGK
jgi:hypothetical protein